MAQKTLAPTTGGRANLGNNRLHPNELFGTHPTHPVFRLLAAMLDYDFENSLGYWIAAAHHAYMRRLAEELAPRGITFRQAQVLGTLSLDGPLSQVELASRILVEPPTLVGVLDRMEELGWIERRVCPNDRRRKLVHPLPAAEEAWKRLVVAGRRVRRLAAQGLTVEQQTTLRDLLAVVQSNVNQESVPKPGTKEKRPVSHAKAAK